MSYDIIGDIHGQADKLEALLTRMGYRYSAGCWRHPDRQAIFVGDFIDRGPDQMRTVNLARDMVESGTALAIMALAWAASIAVATLFYRWVEKPAASGRIAAALGLAAGKA